MIATINNSAIIACKIIACKFVGTESWEPPEISLVYEIIFGK